MRFVCHGVSFAGQGKPVNQDAYCIKRAETTWGDMALLVVCDGMGGLEKGEIASAVMVQAFSRWFQEDLPVLAEQLGATEEPFMAAVQNQWSGLLQRFNLRMIQYAQSQGISMGTTCTAFFAFGQSFLVAHVGDTRVYCLHSQGECCITTDQTFVQQEVAAGRLTAVEALTHPQRNALVQCVGASKVLNPQMVQGNLEPHALYLVCSDGFRQVLAPWEMNEALRQEALECGNASEYLAQGLEQLARMAQARGERDDMTAVVLQLWDAEGSWEVVSC